MLFWGPSQADTFPMAHHMECVAILAPAREGLDLIFGRCVLCALMPGNGRCGNGRTLSRRKRPPPYLPMEKTYSSTGWPSSKVDYTGSSANRGSRKFSLSVMWLQRRRRRAGVPNRKPCGPVAEKPRRRLPFVSPRILPSGCQCAKDLVRRSPTSFLPRDSSGVLPALSLADARAKTAGELGSTRGGQSQSRRLKIKYKLTQTTPIRPMAKGYPKLQLNSGMCLKFMP